MRSISLPVKIINGVASYLLVKEMTIARFYLQGSVSTQDLAHYRHNKVTPFCLSPIYLVKSFNLPEEEIKEWEWSKSTISQSDLNLTCPELKRRNKKSDFC